ncbi:MAG: hypothetical protein JKX84_00430 [Flavobacteriales bacterium]|nr:hypothetical protein [Flavobacteriales bacterium]
MNNNNIEAKDIFIGKGAVIHPTAKIRGVSGKAKSIYIGDHTYIGADVQIICDDFRIGDFGKIHHHTNIHGNQPCSIGHNAWIGQYTIIDSVGGVSIGNNCGIGAHSQLWSHIKYGDQLEGCRFEQTKKLQVGNDVWFVGHSIVSPITAEDKSMALVGSVVTKDMKYNEIYAGNPAKSISDKIGSQFNHVSVEEKKSKLVNLLKKFNPESTIKIVISNDEIDVADGCSYFNVSDRTYSKNQSEEEIAFMKFLLPEKAKFVPQTQEN